MSMPRRRSSFASFLHNNTAAVPRDAILLTRTATGEVRALLAASRTDAKPAEVRGHIRPISEHPLQHHFRNHRFEMRTVEPIRRIARQPCGRSEIPKIRHLVNLVDHRFKVARYETQFVGLTEWIDRDGQQNAISPAKRYEFLEISQVGAEERLDRSSHAVQLIRATCARRRCGLAIDEPERSVGHGTAL